MLELRRKLELFVPITLSFAFFLLLNINLYCEGYNYCNFDAEEVLCGENKHYMCHNNILPKEGELVESIPMTKKLKTLILDKHNDFRNRVAGGNETGQGGGPFHKAARMRELLWDQELAYIAKRHADECSFNHDDCHNTKRFKQSGQNLGKGEISKNVTILSILTVIDSMYEEKNLGFEGNNELTRPEKGYQSKYSDMGHFTAIVNDLTGFIGCGLAFCKNPGEKCFSYYVLTCNYENTNVLGRVVYVRAETEPADRCSDWETDKSIRYPNLCQNNGKVYKEKKNETNENSTTPTSFMAF